MLKQGVGSLQDQAYVHLKNMIMNDELKAGIVYSETRMAKELEISRTPFKSALTRLSQDKYIDILPSRGFRVHVPDEADIEAICQIRTAIEAFCAITLSEQRDTPQGAEAIRQLTRSLQEMRACVPFADAASFRQQDLLFHTCLLEQSHNEDFLKLYDYSIYHQVVATSQKAEVPEREKVETCQEHERILAAISGGDISEIYRSIQQHMQTNRDHSLLWLRQGGASS